MAFGWKHDSGASFFSLSDDPWNLDTVQRMEQKEMQSKGSGNWTKEGDEEQKKDSRMKVDTKRRRRMKREEEGDGMIDPLLHGDEEEVNLDDHELKEDDDDAVDDLVTFDQVEGGEGKGRSNDEMKKKKQEGEDHGSSSSLPANEGDEEEEGRKLHQEREEPKMRRKEGEEGMNHHENDERIVGMEEVKCPGIDGQDDDSLSVASLSAPSSPSSMSSLGAQKSESENKKKKIHRMRRRRSSAKETPTQDEDEDEESSNKVVTEKEIKLTMNATGHRHSFTGNGYSRVIRRDVQAKAMKRKSSARDVERSLLRKEKKAKRKEKFANTNCNLEKMNCFTHDNNHWKVAPFWTLGKFCFCQNANNNSYHCLRSINDKENYLYCEFVTGFKLYQDLYQDPYQLINSIHLLDPMEKEQLSADLETLKHCKGKRQCFVRRHRQRR